MKKTKRIGIVISLMLMISSIIAAFNIMPVLAAAPTDAKNSVVVVVSADGTGSQASGFAIGEAGKPVEYIVTNNHAVRGQYGNTTAYVYFSVASDDKMLANIYYYDADKDIAVLKLPEKTTKRNALVLCPQKYVDLDDEFAALGYPGNQETDWPKYSVDDITVTKGGIKKADRLNGQDVYMLDLEITYGNSGGPLINSKGEVVGINTKSVSTMYGEEVVNTENYALAIDELLDNINTEKVPVTIHKSNILLYSIIGGAALLIVIVLIIVLATKKTKKEEIHHEYRQDNSMPPERVVKKPQKKEKEKEGARLIALGGILNGRKYSIKGSVKIGRDAAKCAIAYPVNTKGVSAVHCEISFDGSTCYIKDLGSTYGTFTMDGRKLPVNTPVLLRAGDKFYLASQANMFEVEF